MKVATKTGFTLVELLVVTLIIAVVVTLSFSAASRMMAKSKATREMENLRQMGPLFTIHAADHQMVLPACEIQMVQADGTRASRQWHEALLVQLYPDTDPADFKTKDWWKRNDTFIRNPLFRGNRDAARMVTLNPGYGLNEMIPENLALASTGAAPSHAELLTIRTPLAALAEPGRTPLVAPCDNYFFRYDDAELEFFEDGTLKDFLSEGKVPILFVDGHVEAVTPSEYRGRKLHLVPIVPIP